MKILMLADGMNAGGAETHIETLVRGLAKRGHAPSVLSCGGEIADRLEQSGFPGFRIAPVGRSLPRFAAAVRTVRALIRKENFEILHAHTRIGALIARAAVAGLSSPPVRIVTVHAHFRTGRLYRWICDWGERTVAVSEDLRAYVADCYRIAPERIDVIPNGIDVCRFCPAESSSVAQNGETTVLFVSRLDADCSIGAYLLCSVAPRILQTPGLEGVRIRIAGSGSELESVRRAADEANTAIGFSAIRVISLRSADRPPALPDLYRSADLFVGVSRAAMEAAACGCAVLLCGNEGYGGILRAEQPGAAAGNFCCRGNPPSSEARLLADLIPLLQSPSRLRALGTEVCRRMRRSFSADRMAELTERSYRRALAQSPGRQSRLRRGESVCIGGYAGCGNLGDDAILSALISSLAKRGVPRACVCALSGDPRRDRDRFGVRCFDRKNPFSVLRALESADLFVCGGGTLLQNRTGNLSLLYYLSLLLLARRCGCRTVYLGGIGPVRGKWARRMTGAVLLRADAVLLRDPLSYSFALRLGVPKSSLCAGADPALLLPLPAPNRGIFLRTALRPPVGSPYCCVSIRSLPPGTSRTALTSAVQSLVRHFSVRPILLVSDRRQDAEFADWIARTVGWSAVFPRDASELLAWISGASFTLSGRLHPLILSVRSGVPCIGLWDGSDDWKIPLFCAQERLPLLPESAPSAAWFAAVGSALSTAPRRRELFRRAEADCSRICALLQTCAQDAAESESLHPHPSEKRLVSPRLRTKRANAAAEKA